MRRNDQSQSSVFVLLITRSGFNEKRFKISQSGGGGGELHGVIEADRKTAKQREREIHIISSSTSTSTNVYPNSSNAKHAAVYSIMSDIFYFEKMSPLNYNDAFLYHQPY